MRQVLLGFANFCRVLVIVAGVATTVLHANAQVTNGTISGSVTDSSGAKVSGADVTILNQATGITSTATTNDGGLYSAPNLPIGMYRIEVKRSGFASSIHDGINLTVGREAAVDFTLKIGETSEQVQVTGDAPLVQTTDSAVGELIDSKQIRELPINGRNLQNLILLVPGVSQVNAEGSPGTYTHGNASTFTAAGLRPVGMMELLDGAIVSNFYREGAGNLTGNTSMGAEAVAEFQTLTNTYSAEFGGQGAVVNESSRSGTNDLHGSVYGFYRTSAVNAANYRFPGQSVVKPSFHKSQFGAAVGGPIVKDRTFFFANYEGLRATIGLAGSGTVPDANARNGMVPCALAPTLPCNGGLATVTVNPAIAKILPLYSAPGASIAGTGTAFFTGVAKTTQSEDYGTLRIDQHISGKDNVFASYVFDNANTLAGSIPAPNFGSKEFGRNQYFTLQENHVFSPSFLNVADVHFVRLVQNIAPQTLGSDQPALNIFGPRVGAVQIATTGLSSIGGGTILGSAQTRYTLSDHAFLTLGRHSLKFGADVHRVYGDVYEPLTAGGVYIFGNLVGLLQGNAISAQGQVPGSGSAQRDFRQTEVFPFVADDFRVSSNLTLNIGIRYGFSTNPVDGANLLYNLINPLTDTAFTPVSHAFANNPSLKNIDPRLGFAFKPFSNEKTSLRGGFGLFHDVIEPRDVLGYVFGYPYVVTVLPAAGQVFPNLGPISVTTPSTNLTPIYSNTHTQYAMEYNLNVQREIAPHTVATIGYEGTSGVHLQTSYNLNYKVPDGMLGGRLYRSPAAVFTNPKAGVINDEQWNGTSLYHSGTVSVRHDGRLQGLASYTFAKCLDVISEPYSGDANTLGESSTGIFDGANIRGSHGRCDYSVSHNFNVSLLYQLPLKGNALVEGYQFGLISIARSGLPFTPLVGNARSNVDNSTNSPPDVVQGVNPIQGKFFTAAGIQWVNPAAFTPQPQGTVGNAGRDSLIGPHYVDTDFNFVKNTPLKFISEATSLQVRWELFNIFNHPNFGLPNGTIFGGSAATPTLSPAAGIISTTVGNMRQMQFGLKILF